MIPAHRSATSPFVYADGLPYRPVVTTHPPDRATSEVPCPVLPPAWDWPEFWDHVHTWMKQQGYAHSTARLYRQVLRNLARVSGVPPAGVTRELLDQYFLRLQRGHCSAHWTALNLCTLRTVFDKLFGLGLLVGQPGPRRPNALPEILSHDEALALLDACSTLRDRLLIGLLYGCGLKVGELRRLRWRDLNPTQKTLLAPGNRRLRSRTLVLPEVIVPLVQTAHRMGLADEFIFAGHRQSRPLSSRWVQCLIRDTARRAGILKPVSPMSLRHSYAVHALEAGANIRELQTALGHRSVRTTLRYGRCLLPGDLESPLDGVESRPSDSPPAPSKGTFAARFKPMSVLAAFISTPPQFVNLLRCQLGSRLFATRRGSTGPP